MTHEEVRELIGRPLTTEPHWRSRNHPAYDVRGDEVWSYTRDGGCSWSDWAWLWRAVNFQGGWVGRAVGEVDVLRLSPGAEMPYARVVTDGCSFAQTS